MHDVVDIGEGVVGTTGEPATSIAPLDFVPLGLCGESFAASLEHCVTEGIVECQGDRGVATNSLDRLTTEKAHPFDLGPTSATLQEGKIRVGDHKEVRSASVPRYIRSTPVAVPASGLIAVPAGAGHVAGRRGSAPTTAWARPADVDQCIGPALVKAGLPVRWEGTSSIRDSGTHQGVRILGQLCGDRTSGVVESKVSIVMSGLGLFVTRPLLGADEVRNLTNRALLSLSEDGCIGIRCGDFDRCAHLVEAEGTHAQTLCQVWEVPQPFSHMRPGPTGSLCHAETLGEPGTRRRRPLGPPRLTSVQLSDGGQQRSEGGCDHAAEPFGLVHQVGRRCLLNYEFHTKETSPYGEERTIRPEKYVGRSAVWPGAHQMTRGGPASPS